MNYVITEMTAGSIDGIAEIEKVCFSSPWTREGIAQELSNPYSHFLTAVTDTVIAGYIGVQEICGEAYITNVAVLPSYRGNGIAKALLNGAISGAKSRNCEFITLEVRESNAPAIALYESLGFETVGKRKNFYSNPTEDAILYTLFFGKE